MPLRAKILSHSFSAQGKLNRPKKYNALNESMVDKITPRLQEWSKFQLANIIVIKGAGKAFCAGGDVVVLVEQNLTGPEKPYVAFMDGHTIGGGVELSVHAPFRIATERTVFAMPETKIGFFPDVGGSFFLPRLDGELGTYLALTSENLRGERWEIVDSTIEEFVTGLPENEPFVLSGATREAIDRCFHYDTIDDIVQALKKEGTEWAQTTINTIEERSPTSVHTENMIASRFMEHPDFTEGVITLLVKSKEDPELKPKWAPAPDANAVDEFFTPRVGETRLPLLTDKDYMKYPHAWIGLPTGEEIKQTLEKTKLFSSEFVRYFVDGRRGKVGVLEK
ncbi:3-hydroxyisobutyryl-CoA hydrolase, partial [Rhizina undulata]